MQLAWALALDVPTLIIAPLSVTRQTIREAQDKLGLEVRYIRSTAEVNDSCQIYITNYEAIETKGHVNFKPELFGAVVLDESSILKNIAGKTRKLLTRTFLDTPYKLACTATPAPNDIQEIGNHAEFLSIMTNSEMSSTFFVHDAGLYAGSHKPRWRLKKHGIQGFYRWLASWAVSMKTPSDIGYPDDGYILPTLKTEVIQVDYDYTPPGMLPGFANGSLSAIDAKRVRRKTLEMRTDKIAEMVNASDEQWIIWCGLNDESNRLRMLIPDSVNVEGKQTDHQKASYLEQFTEGKARVLISKTKIAGMGMNMQNCHNMVFCGLDYSWESYYQAKGRVHRFGQEHPVTIWIITDSASSVVFDSIQAKAKEAEKMSEELIKATREYTIEELQESYRKDWKYRQETKNGEHWDLWLGDSCERMTDIENDSIDLSVYSPPFSDMYVYNATERDLSNSANLDEFFEHYKFIIAENLRITKSGRICCVHVQDPKTFKNKEGFRGIYDFAGQVISAYVEAGWIYRARITIDKNPQIIATRNKDTDLLFVTGKRDSANLAPCVPDILLVFKKPGENEVPIKPYDNGEMNEQNWIEWAHPIWYNIRETDVLNVRQARANDDEKHMCPLQLPLIDRCLKLWSNPGELIFSPFAGIGSELYEAVKLDRRGLGIELKPEYFKVACRNLANAELARTQMTLFDMTTVGVE